MSNENLKNAIEDIMNKNKVNAPKRSFDDKKILQYESDLLSSNVKIEHSICIADLFPGEESHSFGGGDFTRVDYALSWQNWQEQGFRFTLTNIKYSNSKLLIECPTQFKKDTITLLPAFIESLANKANQLMNK
ncbi:hypothetical protein BIY24_00370 [Halobacteriovorax marinus]|uniref:hypothetical protein n=1 Tax=Halobacteriovorax marinus TaxID=97084 RepID=UPI000BC2D2B2|nr:hypothetical protein [Halobacteriovorax marinus]ATH06447.1 hypothetical protein BIY24_00370 [Halobacteriovorax marinus]